MRENKYDGILAGGAICMFFFIVAVLLVVISNSYYDKYRQSHIDCVVTMVKLNLNYEEVMKICK